MYFIFNPSNNEQPPSFYYPPLITVCLAVSTSTETCQPMTRVFSCVHSSCIHSLRIRCITLFTKDIIVGVGWFFHCQHSIHSDDKHLLSFTSTDMWLCSDKSGKRLLAEFAANGQVTCHQKISRLSKFLLRASHGTRTGFYEAHGLQICIIIYDIMYNLCSAGVIKQNYWNIQVQYEIPPEVSDTLTTFSKSQTVNSSRFYLRQTSSCISLHFTIQYVQLYTVLCH